MLDSRFTYCINQLQKTGYKIEFVGNTWGYRTFEEQLELFRRGRENEKLEVECKIPFGKRLLRLADSGSIKIGTVTNATPCTSAHNFGMAIDCKDAFFVCDWFNKLLGYECFEVGDSYGDLNHIEIKGFKLPKYDFRWSVFCSPFGYSFLEKIGGLKND